jgi:hypothetical protein
VLTTANDYTIGKGKVLFKLDGTNGYLDFGNAPDFKITVGIEKKEHYSSRAGVSTKDLEVVVKQTATGSFTLDQPVIDNIRYFIMSTAKASIDQSASSWTDEAMTVYHDLYIDMGKKSLTNIVITATGGSPTYVLDTDYKIDTDDGLLMALSSGSISDAESVEVTGDYGAVTINRVQSAQATTLKGHVMFIGNPPAGRKIDVVGYVSLLPEGDLQLIGEDWTEMVFNMEFLTNSSYNGLFDLKDKGVVT